MDEVRTSPSADELVELGFQLFREQKADVARVHFDAALLKEPDHGRALHNLSCSLIQGNLLPAALSTARRALNTGFDRIGCLMNISAAMNGMGRFEEILEVTDEILREISTSDQRRASVWHNRGITLNHLERLDEALSAYDKALILAETPDHQNMIRSDRALALLGLGRVEEGCREYEVRWVNKLYKSRVWELGLPQWQGQSLTGKSLILHHEQGFGDGVMLARLVPELQKQASALFLAVPGNLVELFKTCVAWSSVPVFEWNEDVEQLRSLRADYHVPMLSALGVLGLEPGRIAGNPYLVTEPERSNLGPDGFRIGLCWASGYHNFALAVRRRYVPLSLLFPLSEIPGVRLVSLQKDAPEKDILNLGAESFIHDPMPRCDDFADTAKVIAGLDLVVSVDSVIAHLAGALGIPCLMLGPLVRCWRWWGGATGWPWYKEFDHFRQTSWNSWDEPVEQVIDRVRLLPNE